MYTLEISRGGVQITLNFTLTPSMNAEQTAYEILSTVEKANKASYGWSEWGSFQHTLACLLDTLRSCVGLSLSAECPLLDLKISLSEAAK